MRSGRLFNSAKIVIGGLIILTLTTCEKDHMLDCFTSTGDETTVSRPAREISEIEIDNNVDVVIHESSIPFINVTAGDNMIEGIVTELRGNRLLIRNENTCNWMRSFKNKYIVDVGMKSINYILSYGSGDVSCADTIRTLEFLYDSRNASGTINLLLNCQKSNINNHTGRTDIHLAGSTNTSIIYINDIGTIDASDYKTNFSYVRNISTGDCRVNAAIEVAGIIGYNGNIYYSGNPQTVSSEITGKGKMISF